MVSYVVTEALGVFLLFISNWDWGGGLGLLTGYSLTAGSMYFSAQGKCIRNKSMYPRPQESFCFLAISMACSRRW